MLPNCAQTPQIQEKFMMFILARKLLKMPALALCVLAFLMRSGLG
jgi:hypothetical protein